MKYILTIITVLLTLLGCQQNKDYDAFIDQNVQGVKTFNKDFDACRGYANLHSVKSEGRQGAGERLILERNLFFTCMKKEGWILKD